MLKYTFKDDFVLLKFQKLSEHVVYFTERLWPLARKGVNMAATAEVALLCKYTGIGLIRVFYLVGFFALPGGRSALVHYSVREVPPPLVVALHFHQGGQVHFFREDVRFRSWITDETLRVQLFRYFHTVFRVDFQLS